MAVAPMFCFVVPRSIPAKKVGILSVILTERNGFDATVLGGIEPGGKPGGAVVETWKVTLFPKVPEFALLREIELLKPFNVAYWQGAGV